jgi:hypothetical protein
MRKRIVYLRLGGGLGNQIFQYIAGLYVAEIQGAEAVFELAGTDSSFHGPKSSIRNLDLPRLKPSNVLLRTYWKFKLRIAGNRSFLLRYLRICRMENLGYIDFDNFAKGSIRLLEGFFITFRYKFNLTELGILEKIKVKNPTKWLQTQLLKAESLKICAIHIRHGDYLLNWEHYGVLSTEYYKRALRFLQLKTDVDEYWIFSDTPENAARIVKICEIERYKIIVQPEESNDSESMVLMGACDYIICANSTFSIVSALFSKASQVLVPESLYRALPNPVDVYPSSWVQIESDWLELSDGLGLI